MKARRRFSTRSLGAIGALALGLTIVGAMTSTRSVADRARALEQELRCPVCQGISIADSPSTSAAQMRRVVEEQLAGGAGDADVRSYFVARFGAWVLLAPASDGIAGVLWVAPGLAMVAGASFVLLRHVRRRRPTTAARAWTPVVALTDVDNRVAREATAGGWTGKPDGSGRLPAAVGAVLVVVAIAAPLAIAIAPRVAGQELSGRPASQSLLALADLETIVQARPDDTVVGLQLGAAYLDANRTADAATTYASILRREPDTVEALIGLGIALLDGGRPDGAITVFDRASALDPTIPDVYLYRALARFAIERAVTEPTRADARRFIAMAPDDPRSAEAQRLLDGASSAAPRPSP